MVLNLATTGAAGFPIWMESHSGNASDKNSARRHSKDAWFSLSLTLSPKGHQGFKGFS